MEIYNKGSIIKRILVSMMAVALVTVLIFAFTNYQYTQKHYSAMQYYEVSCLTNAAYRLSGGTDQQHEIITDIMQKRGDTQFESNVVDVLESHPDIYGKWGEDDIKKPINVNAEKYEKAQFAVEQFIIDKRVPVIGLPAIE